MRKNILIKNVDPGFRFIEDRTLLVKSNFCKLTELFKSVNLISHQSSNGMFEVAFIRISILLAVQYEYLTKFLLDVVSNMY